MKYFLNTTNYHNFNIITDKTLKPRSYFIPYDDKEKLQNIEKKFSFTTKSLLEWMDLEYTATDFNEFKIFYLEFLNQRTVIIKNKFLSALGFANSDSQLNQNTSNISSEFEYFIERLM